jgi:hypothetical protein
VFAGKVSVLSIIGRNGKFVHKVLCLEKAFLNDLSNLCVGIM